MLRLGALAATSVDQHQQVQELCMGLLITRWDHGFDE